MGLFRFHMYNMHYLIVVKDNRIKTHSWLLKKTHACTIYCLVFVNENHLINVKTAERLNSNTVMTMIYLDLS